MASFERQCALTFPTSGIIFVLLNVVRFTTSQVCKSVLVKFITMVFGGKNLPAEPPADTRHGLHRKPTLMVIV